MAYQPYAEPEPQQMNPALIGCLVLLGIVMFAALALVVAVAFSGPHTPGANAAPHPAGATVTDAKFAFRVTGTDTTSVIGGEGGEVTAKGRFVQVRLAVTNRSGKPRVVDEDDQRIRAGGRTYTINSDATLNDDQGPEAGLTKTINPGATDTIVVVFDVPNGVRPRSVEVHGSSSSDGVLLGL